MVKTEKYVCIYLVKFLQRYRITQVVKRPSAFLLSTNRYSLEKILIHEPVKVMKRLKEQEIEIFYRFVGKID